jgi:integrase
MARARNKLNTRQAAALKEPGRHSDGGGLYLAIDRDGPTMRRRWLYLFNWNGKRREMGLGGFPVVSLADARRARDEAERMVREGRDPIEARRAAEQGAAERVTFGQVADEFFEAKKGEFRNAKYREMVRLALTRTAAPLRPLPVADIDTEAVLAALKPVWEATPETGKRFREKIEAVLDVATAKGLRQGENPARWKGHLECLLPRRQKVEKAHHAAMAYRELPAFVEKLRGEDVIAAKALEFCILTASRSGEVYGARWAEINTAEKVWTIPPHRMKSGRGHRVPLSSRAVEILEEIAKARTSEFVFPSPRGNRPLSHVAMAKVMDRLGARDATVHGFRSSFRDWAGHETHFPREIAEQALAHRLGDAAELAYKRGDFLEKRRALMDAWAAFCTPKDKGENIIAFKKSGGDA